MTRKGGNTMLFLGLEGAQFNETGASFIKAAGNFT